MNFGAWRNWFRGEDCVVVAPGPSSHDPQAFDFYCQVWTIACNRAVTYAAAELAVCVEPFRDPMWPILRASSPMVVFSHLCENRRGQRPHPRIVKFPDKDILPWFDETRPGDPLWCAMSPFWGVAVATFLGFDLVGIIGVDLLDPERWVDIHREQRHWKDLVDLAERKGTRVIQLNPKSALEVVPVGSWDEIRKKDHGRRCHTSPV